MLVTELRKGKQPEDFLFTRNVEPVYGSLRGTWEELVKAAGLPGLLLHDFRRYAVRNMIRRGVPTAREISGHKTDAVFNRYNIVSVADLQDAAKKIEAGAGAKPVIHSSFIVEGQEEENRKEGDARKPV